MDLIVQIKIFIENLIDIILSEYFIIILFSIILLYHILCYFIRDKKYVIALKKCKDPKEIKLIDLKELPLVNILIPAWNEGKIFEGCLESITKLTYPNLKVIINAGGSKPTIKIAESYKNLQNFEILYQKKGEGKIKAINDCLKYISEGVVYLIDADIYLDDNIFLQMLYPIITEKEKIVISTIKPHNFILNRDLVKYVFINRNPWFHKKISNYSNSVSQNVCMNYEVIQNVKKFSEGKLADDGFIIGSDIRKKDYKIYLISNVSVDSFNFPLSIRQYFRQNLRWLENFLFIAYKSQKFQFLKFIVLTLISLYIFVSPFLFFIHIYLSIFSLILIFSIYLKKIRKILFFKSISKKTLIKFKLIFLLKLIFYIYVDLIMNIIVSFELIFYRKAYKRRKNLLD
ncbi:MAG: glycosyltransferase [Candidatus Hermodarchaeota archaeon]